MNIKVRFYGDLRQFESNTDWDGACTVEDIVSRVPGLEIEPSNFIVSRNKERCDIHTKLEEGDEIHFYPMIMGG